MTEKNWILIVREGEHGETRTKVFGPYTKAEAKRYKEHCPVDCEVKEFDDFAQLLRDHDTTEYEEY